MDQVDGVDVSVEVVGVVDRRRVGLAAGIVADGDQVGCVDQEWGGEETFGRIRRPGRETRAERRGDFTEGVAEVEVVVAGQTEFG